MDHASLAKLLTPDGWALLNALPPYDEKLAMAVSERLRAKGFEQDMVAAALTQSRLRGKAAAKFGPFVEGMLFTQAGLEQATRLVVGARHAQRYLAAGVDRVVDLTCGVGADAMAFAGVDLRVLATEIDEVTAAVATVNLRAFPEATVRHADGLALDLAAEGFTGPGAGIYADPARRTRSGKRIVDPKAYAPALDDVWDLRSQVPAVGIKVGPGISHNGLPDDCEAQWVSVDGDVVEAGLWFGPLAPDGHGRTALLLRTVDERTDARTFRADEHTEAPPRAVERVADIGSYLYEPDGAVIRAGLVADASRLLDGRLLDRTIAYVTTDTPHAETSTVPIATGYRILDSMPFGLKKLRGYLRERDVGRVTIKKRGTAVTPEHLRSQLALRGSAEATIVLTRVAGSQQILVVEPLDRTARSHPPAPDVTE
ncbi:THUMP-like domain-containing protein [Sanguibacter suaedae]|uniref:SAM-dependent methyltransferase n=1 Tax=Sanguibacter suaedae TaxID=2795737 RepID=A0A934I6H9_9MICO|nr:class I SAM-dependent methyltransferase [Sanguibacter suaedae]MBI9114092.1 SAM-dependent methyltransferase [Sanguibacter suaedae]